MVVWRRIDTIIEGIPYDGLREAGHSRPARHDWNQFLAASIFPAHDDLAIIPNGYIISIATKKRMCARNFLLVRQSSLLAPTGAVCLNPF